MNKMLLLAFALPTLVACGPVGYRHGRTYNNGTVPAAYPGYDSAPDYLIDAGAGVDSPIGTYAVTTNGRDWYLGWQGDGLAHRFTGNVYCPVGCTFENPRFDNLMVGDTVTSIANNHLGFDAVTDYTGRQFLSFGAALQPITFDLAIDGHPAINQEVFFPSGGYVAYADIMPFNLVSSNATFASGADLAPEAVLKPGTKTVTFQAPAPLKQTESTGVLQAAQ